MSDLHMLLTDDEVEALKLSAAKAFSPRTPVSTRELFAGRWDQMRAIAGAVGQIGLHAVVFGERGVGKTSLTYVIRPLLHVMDEHSRRSPGEPVVDRIVIRVNANTTDTFSSLWRKAFDEIAWDEDRPSIGLKPAVTKKRLSLREALGLSDELTIDDVRRTLAHLPGSVFVFDEFDRLPKRATSSFTDLIKALSDGAIPSTVVLVGVADTVDGLVKDHASIGRALVQIAMPRMNEKELQEILSNAEKSLDVRFEPSAAHQIVRMSQGLPHFTHLVGQHSVEASADARRRIVTTKDVEIAFRTAVREADQSVAKAYASAVHSAQPGAKYAQVLLAAAIAAYTAGDSFGYFQPSKLVEPMSAILGRSEEIAGFNKHLADFTESKRGAVLERTGSPRAYRFRFSNPLLPPYVIMKSIKEGLVSAQQANAMLQHND